MGKGLYLSQLSFLKHLSNFSTTHYVCVAVISQFIPYVVLHDYVFFDHVTHLFQIKTHVHQMRITSSVGNKNTTIMLISYSHNGLFCAATQSNLS